MTRKGFIRAIALFLGVTVSFPESEEEDRKPKDRDYRLTRIVQYDGKVHWRIEQFVSKRDTLLELYPNHTREHMIKVNGLAQPREWIPVPGTYGSEEEAIKYLNETLRCCEVLEATHYYVD